MYFNGLVMSIAEFIANLIIGVFLMQIGLKNTMISSFTVMSLSSVVYLFPIITLNLWYSAILFVMRFAVTSAFAAVFYGTNALFRQDLVAVIFDICNMFARLIAMGAPVVATYSDTTVMAVFFCLSLLGLMCAAFITEKGKKKRKRKHHKKHKQA